MAGKWEKRNDGKVGKGILLALSLILASTVITPLTPTIDYVPSASAASSAAHPAAYPDRQQADFVPMPEIVPADGDAPAEEESPSSQDGAFIQSGAPVVSEVSSGQVLSAGAPPADEPPPTATEDAYFADAAFVGDSRTQGFELYSGLKEGAYFATVGATVQTVLEKATQDGPSGKQTIMDALSAGTYGKIYIMLGVNELGWYRAEDFAAQYGKVIDRIRADHPEAVVVVESILPVSAKQDQKRSYVNNQRIVQYNQLLQALAEEKGCVWLDVGSAVMGEDGTLPSALSTDGVHLNTAGCKKWLEFLRDNPVSPLPSGDLHPSD